VAATSAPQLKQKSAVDEAWDPHCWQNGIYFLGGEDAYHDTAPPGRKNTCFVTLPGRGVE
jgi:hypothetical protein